MLNLEIKLYISIYSQLNGYRLRFNVESVPVDSPAEDPEVATEVWQVKEGSIYDGDTLRATKENEELKIRFCGIDAPEKKMPMGIEARDHLRSIIDRGNGTVEIERVKDSYEVWILLKPDFESQIHLNTWMIENGMGKIDPVTSNTCLKKENLIWAEEIAKKDKFIGVD